MAKKRIPKSFIVKLGISAFLLLIWCVFYFVIFKIHDDFTFNTNGYTLHEKFMYFLQWNIKSEDIKIISLNIICLYVPLFVLAINLIPFVFNFIVNSIFIFILKIIHQLENYLNFVRYGKSLKYINIAAIIIKDVICFGLLFLYMNNLILLINNLESRYSNYNYSLLIIYLVNALIIIGSVIIISRIFDKSGNQKQYEHLVSNHINRSICAVCVVISLIAFYCLFIPRINKMINVKSFSMIMAPIMVICTCVLFFKNTSRRKYSIEEVCSSSKYTNRKSNGNKIISSNKNHNSNRNNMLKKDNSTSPSKNSNQTIAYMKPKNEDDYSSLIE